MITQKKTYNLIISNSINNKRAKKERREEADARSHNKRFSDPAAFGSFARCRNKATGQRKRGAETKFWINRLASKSSRRVFLGYKICHSSRRSRRSGRRTPSTWLRRSGPPRRPRSTLTRAEQTRAEKLGGKMVQNRPKRTNSRAKMVQNRPKWSKTGQNIPKYTKMVQNRPGALHLRLLHPR